MKDVRGVAVCLACGGAFLAAAAVDTVARAFDEHAQSMASLAAQQGSKRVDAARTATCPMCSTAMARFRVGPVEVDTCFEHGSWYDRGELAAVRQALERGLPTAPVEPVEPPPTLELARAPAPVAPAAPLSFIVELQEHERRMARRPRHRRRHGRSHSALEIVEDILDILT